MLRKPTRPTMVHMPRRDPSHQLPCSTDNLPPRRPNQRPAVRRKRLNLAEKQQISSAPSPAPKSSGETDALPRSVTLSTYAREPYTLLQEILPGNMKLSEVEASFISQIPVLHRRGVPRPVLQPAWDVKTHRLWKLQHGRYRLLGWDQRKREVLLAYKNSKVRTPLPQDVVEPQDTKGNTFLEIGKPEDGQRHRVSAKWVSV